VWEVLNLHPDALHVKLRIALLVASQMKTVQCRQLTKPLRGARSYHLKKLGLECTHKEPWGHEVGKSPSLAHMSQMVLSLKESSNMQTFLATLLPPSTPALRSLRRLGLVNLKLIELPGDVLQELQQLTLLDISGNSLARFPPALTSVTNLEVLNLAFNPKIKFQAGDHRLLAALPKLKFVKLENKRAVHPAENAAAFLFIGKKLPDLDLQLVDGAHELDCDWRVWT